MSTIPLAIGNVRAASPPLDLIAPAPDFTPVNQLRVSGNACGPAALLTAFAAGSARWQAVSTAVPGEGDRERLSALIRHYGIRDSSHLSGRQRWDRTAGVNLLDLVDMANEMRGSRWLPKVSHTILVLRDRESHPKLLERCHGDLARSLRGGFPPIVSLRRMAMRNPPGNASPVWTQVHGHFAVVTALPKRLPRGADSFPFRYADPWGGVIREGVIHAGRAQDFPALVAILPESAVGARFLKKDERSIVTVAAAIGDL